MQKNIKHEFALYWPKLSEYLKEYPAHALFQIDDLALVHRITSVLRLQQEDPFVLFDDMFHAHVELGKSSKKTCMVQIHAVEKNKQLLPKITFGLPILKKEAFEDALYSLVEYGATTLQPLTTEKVHRSSWSTKETERAERIVIAAAEQSKQFAVPSILPTISLTDFITKNLSGFTHKVFFDPDGQTMSEFTASTKISSDSSIFLLVGPEGDLTPQEKELLKKAGFSFVALTPTVLRAQQAAALGLGIFRTLA